SRLERHVAMQAAEHRYGDRARFLPALVEADAPPHPNRVDRNELRPGVEQQLRELRGAVRLPAAGDTQPGQLLSDHFERQGQPLCEFQLQADTSTREGASRSLVSATLAALNSIR